MIVRNMAKKRIKTETMPMAADAYNMEAMVEATEVASALP